jgi:hypothetical protein
MNAGPTEPRTHLRRLRARSRARAALQNPLADWTYADPSFTPGRFGFYSFRSQANTFADFRRREISAVCSEIVF